MFRHFYAVPSHKNRLGEEVGAIRGVLASMLSLLENGVSHIGVATDHVIESFRNEMWPGYKTSEGIDPSLLSQFWPLEDCLESMGILVWPMVELEADDAIASAALSLSKLSDVDTVYICSPDKDFGQCIMDKKVVQLNRRDSTIRDEQHLRDKFGFGPESIPDYLALVGDAADGYPGVTGWGEKSASKVLAKYRHLDVIPKSSEDWEVEVRGANRLSRTLQEEYRQALLFRDLATLRTEKPEIHDPHELLWMGPRPTFPRTVERLEAPGLGDRVNAIVQSRGGLQS